MVDWSYRLFLLLLVFSPLAYGTTQRWSLAFLEVGCLLAWFLYPRSERADRLPLYRPPGLTPLLLLGGFMLFQLVPLPPSVLQPISPEAWQIYRETIWVARPGAWMPLSVVPEATLAQFFRLSAYAAFYLLTTQLLSGQERLKKTLAFIAAFAGLYALVGMLQYFLPGQRILWVLKEWPERAPHAFGTYVNGNHYAGLMEMLLPVVLTWFLAIRPGVRYGSWRENLVGFLGHPRANPHILTGLAAVLIGLSIFFSLSRGGILSTLGSLVILGLLFLLRGDSRKTGILVMLFMGLMLFSVGFLGWDPILDRFDRVRDNAGQLADQRPVYWQDSARIIDDFPLAGTGFGTFVHIYPRYQTVPTGNLFVDHAHNDYLELLTDGGMIGALLVVWFLGALLLANYRALRRRKNRTSIFLALGSFTGMLALGLHSFTDFNFYIGANGLYFIFLAGLMASAAHGRSREVAGQWTELKPFSAGSARFVYGVTGSLLPITLMISAGGLLAQGYTSGVDLSEILKDRESTDLKTLRQSLERAIRFDPMNARYRRASAELAREMGDPDTAAESLVEAVRRNPLDGLAVQALAQTLHEKEASGGAEILMRSGARNDRTSQDRARAYAAWLLAEGRSEEAFAEIRAALTGAPRDTWTYLALMFLYRVSDEEMKRALPEASLAYVAYGNYLLSAGRAGEAEQAYRTAFRNAGAEEKPSSKTFWAVCRYFEKQQDNEEALQVIRKGIERFPFDAGMRRTAAALYERMGITRRAIEAYRQALLLDPKNQGARKRLKQLEEGP